MLEKKRLKLMEQVEAHQLIAREHEIDLRTAKLEEEQLKAASKEQLRILKELNDRIGSAETW